MIFEKPDSGRSSNAREEPAQAPVDHAHIASLLAKEYSGLIMLMRRKLRDQELADDLVNDAIAITLEHGREGRLMQPDRIGGYVFKVSMNLLRNRLRNFDNRAELRSSEEALESLCADESNQAESVEVRERATRVIESLASPRDREVIKRFYLDEEDKQTICDEMGLTPLQFTQVMSRARQRMKAAFEAQGLTRNDLLTTLLLVGISFWSMR